jgi:hypothetical protein
MAKAAQAQRMAGVALSKNKKFNRESHIAATRSNCEWGGKEGWQIQ